MHSARALVTLFFLVVACDRELAAPPEPAGLVAIETGTAAAPSPPASPAPLSATLPVVVAPVHAPAGPSSRGLFAAASDGSLIALDADDCHEFARFARRTEIVALTVRGPRILVSQRERAYEEGSRVLAYDFDGVFTLRAASPVLDGEQHAVVVGAEVLSLRSDVPEWIRLDDELVPRGPAEPLGVPVEVPQQALQREPPRLFAAAPGGIVVLGMGAASCALPRDARFPLVVVE